MGGRTSGHSWSLGCGVSGLPSTTGNSLCWASPGIRGNHVPHPDPRKLPVATKQMGLRGWGTCRWTETRVHPATVLKELRREIIFIFKCILGRGSVGAERDKQTEDQTTNYRCPQHERGRRATREDRRAGRPPTACGGLNTDQVPADPGSGW